MAAEISHRIIIYSNSTIVCVYSLYILVQKRKLAAHFDAVFTSLHISASTDNIIAVIKATYLLQSILSKEADIYPVITGTKAQPSFVSLCCLAIAMTLRGPPLSTSRSQSPIRSDAISAERSHWANSIPAFKTRLSNLVNGDELDFGVHRQKGQFVHKDCLAREWKHHSRSDRSSLVDTRDSTHSKLYERGSDKRLWRFFVEGQKMSGADDRRWCWGPSCVSWASAEGGHKGRIAAFILCLHFLCGTKGTAFVLLFCYIVYHKQLEFLMSKKIKKIPLLCCDGDIDTRGGNFKHSWNFKNLQRLKTMLEFRPPNKSNIYSRLCQRVRQTSALGAKCCSNYQVVDDVLCR